MLAMLPTTIYTQYNSTLLLSLLNIVRVGPWLVGMWLWRLVGIFYRNRYQLAQGGFHTLQ
jgi:hypothetical protein